MPELPEVETTVKDLQKKIPKRTLVDIWTDSPKMVRLPKSFEDFKKEIEGEKIGKIWFKSEEGKGLTFSFTLPVKKELEEFPKEF